jgi:hypothetical protein
MGSKTLKDGILSTIHTCKVGTLGSQAPLLRLEKLDQSRSYLVAGCIKLRIVSLVTFSSTSSKDKGEHYDEELIVVFVEFLTGLKI